MPITNQPEIWKAAQRVFEAALRRDRVESNEASGGRLTAGGSADLDMAHYEWDDALDAYWAARNAAEVAR